MVGHCDALKPNPQPFVGGVLLVGHGYVVIDEQSLFLMPTLMWACSAFSSSCNESSSSKPCERGIQSLTDIALTNASAKG